MSRHNSSQTPNTVTSRGLSDWLMVGIFFLVALGFILGGLLVFDSQQKVIRQANENQLAFIARAKVDEIARWRNERVRDLLSSSESPFFQEAVDQLINNPGDENLRGQTWRRLNLIDTSYGYKAVSVVLPDGKVQVSTDDEMRVLEPETLQILREVAATGKPVFGDFFLDRNGEPAIDVAAPIRDKKSRLVALLLLRIDPKNNLYPLLESWPLPESSAETLIVRREGDTALFLHPLRHNAAPPLTFSVPLTRTEVPAVQAVLGKRGIMEGVDYRGEAVEAYLVEIPDSPWRMVAKIDRSEMMVKINDLARQIFVFCVLGVALSAITIFFVLSYRQRHLYRQLLESERNYSASMAEKQAVLYGIGDAVIAANRAGQVTHLNPVAEKLTGWSEAEALGRPLEDIFNLIDEATRTPRENPFRQVMEEGRVVNLAGPSLLITRDGREIPVADSAAPVRDEQNDITGVVLVFHDQTLERQSERSRSLFEDTLSASLNEIYIFDGESLFYRSANRGALENLQVKLEELRTRTPLDVKNGITQHEFHHLLQPLLRGDQPKIQYEAVHRRADGTTYPAECHLQLVDFYGERVFLEVALDITVRRQALDALRESEERHRLLADNAHDIIWTLDLDSKLTYVSPSVLHLLGYAPEELVGKPFEILIPAEIVADARQTLQDALLSVQLGLPFTNFRVELQNLRKDGTPVWVDVSIGGMYNESGAFVGMVGVTRDISERHAAQEALRRSEESYRLLANNATDVIWTTDVNGRFTFVSPTVKSLLGYDTAFFLGKKFDANLPPEKLAHIKPLLDKMFAEGHSGNRIDPVMYELERPRIDGDCRFLEVTVSGMFDEGGQFVGLVGVTRDITERRNAEEKLHFRRRFAELLSRISTMFISLTTGQVDEEINQALAEIGAFSEVDRAFVFTFDETRTAFAISHEWCRPDMSARGDEINFLNLLEHREWVNTLMRNEAIILEGPEQIAAFQGQAGSTPVDGLSSIALFPLWMNQQLFGCVGFESMAGHDAWDLDRTSFMQQFANVLSISFERIRLVREIEKRAVRDELTGAYNRRGLTEIAHQELQRARRYHHPIGLIFFDIDYFKQINDTLGHVAGDLVLKEIASRCGEVIREVDILCRWGGDEFLVLLPESDMQFTCQVGERLHESICREPFRVYDQEVAVSISVGISGTADPQITLEEMLANADESLYTAKQAGRNKVHCGKFA